MHNNRITRFTTMHTCTVNHVYVFVGFHFNLLHKKHEFYFMMASFFDRFKMDLSIAEAQVFEMNSFLFRKRLLVNEFCQQQTQRLRIRFEMYNLLELKINSAYYCLFPQFVYFLFIDYTLFHTDHTKKQKKQTFQIRN